MKQVKVLSAVGLLALAGAAQADVTSSVAIVSDYDFRGITQTGEKPALQVSLDYASSFGWYAGIWGSNVEFANVGFSDGDINTASTEVDLYTGFKGTAGDFGYDAGLIYYVYSGASDLNFAEIYGKVSFKFLSAGLYFSNDFAGKQYGSDSDSGYYVYTDAALPAGPVSINLHVGMSGGDGVETALFGGTATTPGIEDSYIDASVGVSYASDGFTVGIKYVAIDAGDAPSDDRIILSFSTALPFAK